MWGLYYSYLYFIIICIQLKKLRLWYINTLLGSDELREPGFGLITLNSRALTFNPFSLQMWGSVKTGKGKKFPNSEISVVAPGWKRKESWSGCPLWKLLFNIFSGIEPFLWASTVSLEIPIWALINLHQKRPVGLYHPQLLNGVPTSSLPPCPQHVAREPARTR